MNQRPWSGLSHGQIIHQVTSMKSLQLASGVPSILKKFIFKCLAVKPEERPTFAEILPMLEDIEDELVGC